MIFDKATEMAAPGAAVVATGSTPGLAINPRMLPTCDWVIYTLTMPAGTNETYVFTLEVSNLVAGTYTAIATFNWPRAHGVGKIHLPIVGDLANFQDNDSLFLRTTLTVTGAAPSCIYGSYITKSTTGIGLGRRQGEIVTFP
jgi:hypothetical protein